MLSGGTNQWPDLKGNAVDALERNIAGNVMGRTKTVRVAK